MRAVARKSREATIADRIIDADLRFIEYLLTEPDVDIPKDSIVIHAHELDPEMSYEAMRMALTARQRVRAKRELARPALVVHEDRRGVFTVSPRDWDDLALEFSLQVPLKEPERAKAGSRKHDA